MHHDQAVSVATLYLGTSQVHISVQRLAVLIEVPCSFPRSIQANVGIDLKTGHNFHILSCSFINHRTV
jgi:hypothetical protein